MNNEPLSRAESIEDRLDYFHAVLAILGDPSTSEKTKKESTHTAFITLANIEGKRQVEIADVQKWARISIEMLQRQLPPKQPEEITHDE